MSGLVTGLLSGDVHKICCNDVVGDGLYLHNGKCYRVQKLKGNALYLAPYPCFVGGDGLFLKHGYDISDVAGLLMGKNTPFRNIPFWDGHCNYLFVEEIYKKAKYSVFILSV